MLIAVYAGPGAIWVALALIGICVVTIAGFYAYRWLSRRSGARDPHEPW